MKKSPYKTKQSEDILRYFADHPQQSLRAQDLFEYFRSQQKKIGLATIYRQLDKLVQKGVLLKHHFGQQGVFSYQWANRQGKPEGDVHIKCETCGKLSLLRCQEIMYLNQHILQHHGFCWNSQKSLFYGVCQDCQFSRKENYV